MHTKLVPFASAKLCVMWTIAYTHAIQVVGKIVCSIKGALRHLFVLGHNIFYEPLEQSEEGDTEC